MPDRCTEHAVPVFGCTVCMAVLRGHRNEVDRVRGKRLEPCYRHATVHPDGRACPAEGRTVYDE